MSNYSKYIGLPYLAGKQDCYSLCRNYLFDAYGMVLPNFARPNNFWEDPNLDLYANYRRWGFEPIMDKPIAQGDVLLMPILTTVNSHAAVVVEGNQILHHLPGRLSCLDPLWPKWGSRATTIIRHPDITSFHTQQQTTVQLHEIIDAHILRDPGLQEKIAGLLESSRGAVRNP